jgi:hypothetical protein
MSDDTIYTFVPSTSRGRYALDDPLHGQDLTSGQSLALLLRGRWIDGSIEHVSCLYAREHAPQPVSSGNSSWPAMATCVASARVGKVRKR